MDDIRRKSKFRRLFQIRPVTSTKRKFRCWYRLRGLIELTLANSDIVKLEEAGYLGNKSTLIGIASVALLVRPRTVAILS